MAGFNFRSTFTIAKKEFMDNIRNKWIIVLTIIFVLLIIIFSYVAGAGAGVTPQPTSSTTRDSPTSSTCWGV